MARDYSRFSDGAHAAVVRAERVARQRGHALAGPEDLLVALAEADPVARRTLEKAGTTAASIRARLEQWTPSGAESEGFASFSPPLQRAVERAGRFAAQERAAEVTGALLLRALLDDEDEIVWRVLLSVGVDPGPLARPAPAPPRPSGAQAPARATRPSAWALLTAVWRT